MRNSKIVALVATAALLVIGAAFTSFAATGWQQFDGVWKFFDKYGDAVTETWKKSGNDMYYLDENGEMATATLIEDDDHLYYVDDDGKMVKNDWRLLANDDDDDFEDSVYYYFQSNGRAYKGGTTTAFKTIRGAKYCFNADGKMLYGWVGGNSDFADDYSTAIYYCGDPSDGSQKTRWQKIYIEEPTVASDKDADEYWFFFGTNGKKYADKQSVSIDGKKYAFDKEGIMASSWVVATPATAGNATVGSALYFSTPEDGARYTKDWFRVVPETYVNATDSEAREDTPHWYYALGDGTLATSQIKSIKGKKYAFDENGSMLAGLYYLTFDANGDLDTIKSVDDADAVDTYTLPSTSYIGTEKNGLYFFGDEETDGSMKTGTTTVNVDGDDYGFFFKTGTTSKGVGYNGLKGNNFYVNGLKVKADGDQKYQLYKAVTNTNGDVVLKTGSADCKAYNASKVTDYATQDYAVLTSSGARIKSGTKKDAEDMYIEVKDYVVQRIYVK